MIFLDTNVLAYACLNQDEEKHQRAARIVADAFKEPLFTLSTQVLFELSAVLFRKSGQSAGEIRNLVRLFSTLPIVNQTAETVSRAVELTGIYNLSIFDAGIIAAAESAGCDQIWSEDFNEGQEYCGIRLVNPFA